MGRAGRGRADLGLTAFCPSVCPFQNACPPTTELVGQPSRLFWEPMKVRDIRWNFEKFLVGPNGVPIMRWHHRTQISTIKADILAYMKQAAPEAGK